MEYLELTNEMLDGYIDGLKLRLQKDNEWVITWAQRN